MAQEEVQVRGVNCVLLGAQEGNNPSGRDDERVERVLQGVEAK